MRKSLPFTKPLAYGQQYYAFPLGILASHPQANDWVLSNYLQVAYVTDPSIGIDFSFYLYDYSISPWLETLKLNRELANAQSGGVNGLVRTAISADFYVYLTLNERYVPERLRYDQGLDGLHDVLVRGVDDEADVFEILGYDRNQVFRSSTVPQDELAVAYHSVGRDPFFEVPLTLYRFNPRGTYELDLQFIRQSLIEYLESFNTSLHFRALRTPWDLVYGMATYEELEKYIDRYARREVEYDILNLHTLWEHKRLMLARLTRCAQSAPALAELVAPYQRVERLAWALRLTMMAHGDAPQKSFMNEAAPILHAVRDTERKLLTQAVGALDHSGGA
ncbi:hypothetical protein [Catellatospora methionotrophica]|uniref:hypothetical protein n=1 Tax=Catellatospora methionotrophica TaxID=121620 RepID=UPI003404D7BC